MNSPRLSLLFSALALLAGGTSVVVGQVEPRRVPSAQVAPSTPRPELVVLNAIRSHPVTAPYPIMATWQKGKVVLSGVVGTKQVHDTAVRLAIAIGVPFRDDLVVDTGTAHFVAQSAAAVMGGGTAGPLGTQSSSPPYIYPPPLFGRLDDPFFGYVPPLVSFPPWWSRRNQTGSMAQPGMIPNGVPPASGAGAPPNVAPPASGAAAPNGAPREGWRPLEVDPVKGQVDVSVDMAGQVFLRGSVISTEAAREIEDAARSVPGVTGVFSQLEVIPRRADPNEPPPPPLPMPAGPEPDGVDPTKPPSPEPAIVPVRPRLAPATAAPAALDSQALSRRVVGSLERRPIAAELPVKVRSTDGVVTLSGQVNTAYQAMIVYRAAQQTPGVREIIDRLEFAVPDEDHPNPLIQRGRPEDIEPYLASQIRRHVGDLAHIDRVQARGDVLELRGTTQNAADQERLQAILRSIPVLHGFKLETKFNPE
jgi:osmotically-inducible protein OsmY